MRNMTTPLQTAHRIATLVVASILLLLLPHFAHSYNLFDFKSNIDYDRKNDGRDKIKAHRLERHSQRDDSNARHVRINLEEQTLSTGLFHTCAITYRAGVEDSCGEHPCGPAKCWGHNDRGQSNPPPGVMFEQLSAGGFFTCGLKPGGKVACWGDIDHPPKSLELLSSEELSDFKHARRMQQQSEGTNPRHVNGGDYYIQVSSGMKHACAISRVSEVHCWGRNDYGESSPPDGTFVQVSHLISAGHSFTCGIRPNRAVECWGKNDMGQSSPPPYPENIFQQISTSLGGDHACGVLAEEGDIRCWGNNGRGQSENQDGKFLQVSAGTRNTCAVRDDADDAIDGDDFEPASTIIHCWGSRANFVEEAQKEKRQNGDYHEHRQISLGQDHACATAAKNAHGKTSLQCWWMAGSDFDAHRIP
ncbi:hypothetical protein ACHAXR_006507, partial [Thalassiosira sp. AJA248-18]